MAKAQSIKMLKVLPKLEENDPFKNIFSVYKSINQTYKNRCRQV